MPTKTMLQLAVKAYNDTASPDGLAPTLLFFGIVPRISIHSIELPRQRERMKALHCASKQMSSVMAQSRLNRAAGSRVTGTEDPNFKIGDTVLVYRSEEGK